MRGEPMLYSDREIRNLYGRRWREFGAAAGVAAIRQLVADEMQIDLERVRRALEPQSVGP